MSFKILIATAVISMGAATGAFAAESQAVLWNATAPRNGQNAGVVSPNAAPPGFSDGTAQNLRAQTLAHWFATQGDTMSAQAPLTQPNG